MHLLKFIICFSAFITKICAASLIIQTSKAGNTGIVEATVNILERCYMNEVSTVGVAGVSAASISETLSSRETVFPITLIDETSRSVDNGPASLESNHKLQVFVVTATDTENLEKTLVQIKKSRWWNHMASYLVIDWPTSNSGCSKAYEMLWETWKMDLLNSKFICHDEKRGMLIYTFNPYTSKAPAPWQLENTYQGFNDHIWSLFVRVYRKSEKNFATLDWDKTTDLAGYEIRTSVKGMEEWWFEDSNRKPAGMNRVQNISADILMSSLNAAWEITKYLGTDTRSVDSNGVPNEEMGDIVYGKSDIGINIVNHYYTMNYKTTYPHIVSGLSIVTQYRGLMSTLEKIASVLDRASHIGLLLVCLTTLLFFRFFLRNPPMIAFLNFVRILSIAPLTKIPIKLGPRIYLGSLFIFVITIQGIYQGRLASLLTKKISLPDVNRLDDLGKYGHTIYGHEIYRPCFNDSTLQGRYVGLNQFNCTPQVLGDRKAACTNIEFTLVTEAARFNLHLSHHTMITVYGTYLIRPDWPLEDRVNTVLRRLYDSGVLELRIDSELQSTVNAIEAYENKHKDDRFNVIKFGQLGFAFVILATGLAFATVVFIFEVELDPSNLAILRNRIRRRIKSLFKKAK